MSMTAGASGPVLWLGFSCFDGLAGKPKHRARHRVQCKRGAKENLEEREQERPLKRGSQLLVSFAAQHRSIRWREIGNRMDKGLKEERIWPLRLELSQTQTQPPNIYLFSLALDTTRRVLCCMPNAGRLSVWLKGTVMYRRGSCNYRQGARTECSICRLTLRQRIRINGGLRSAAGSACC
ncbi:hypothetical protein GGI35DRAFT_213273 [Trichoderma velutinum]